MNNNHFSALELVQPNQIKILMLARTGHALFNHFKSIIEEPNLEHIYLYKQSEKLYVTWNKLSISVSYLISLERRGVIKLV